MPRVKKQVVTIEGKCIRGHKFLLTPAIVEKARDLGVVMCPTCGDVATVRKIQIKEKQNAST